MTGLLHRLFGPGTPPDGQAATLQTEAMAAGRAMSAPAPARRQIARPETIIAAALAQKVLHGWMQNRLQTRYPLTLNLGNRAPDEAALVSQAVAYALRAVGADADAVKQAEAWLAAVGGRLADDAGADPLGRVQLAQLGPYAYAACAGALGRHTSANRRFLYFLAARLAIPDEAARSLNRRFAP